MIKVAITDDHLMVIKGLKDVLDSIAEFSTTGIYTNAADLIVGLQNEMPDVLLLDLQLPDKRGKDLVPMLLQQYPDLRILILSSLESSSYIREMMHKGCKGYLFKSTTDEATLVAAIKSVYEGDVFLHAEIKSQLLREMLSAQRKFHQLQPVLTRREREVLRLIAAGYQNPQIAVLLFISLRTVETHRYNLMQKLEVRNTAELVKEAMHYNF